MPNTAKLIALSFLSGANAMGALALVVQGQVAVALGCAFASLAALTNVFRLTQPPQQL